MTAYECMKLDELREKVARGERLSPAEERQLERLDTKARAEWEAQPPARWEGGHPDMF